MKLVSVQVCEARRQWGGHVITSWVIIGALVSKNAVMALFIALPYKTDNNKTYACFTSIHLLLYLILATDSVVKQLKNNSSLPTSQWNSVQAVLVFKQKLHLDIAGPECRQSWLGDHQVQSCRQKVSSLNLGQDLLSNFPHFVHTDGGITPNLNHGHIRNFQLTVHYQSIVIYTA